MDKNEVLEDLLAEDLGQASAVKNEVSVSGEGMLSKLTPEAADKARQLAGNLEKDAGSILEFGAETQRELGAFSNGMINEVSNNDLGEVGDMLASLMVELQDANPDDLAAKEPGFFKKFFKKINTSINETVAQYQKAGVSIDLIAKQLNTSVEVIKRDNGVLEKLYEKNLEYFNDLNVHIAAGELKLAEIDEVTMPALVERATSTGDQMLAQEVSDLRDYRSRLDKRVHDLKLSREISIQQAPQIRLIQNSNQALAEKIQSSIYTAIPLWKNQVAIALSILRQKNAVNAQQIVSDTTNELLKKNSEMLKIASVETYKETERGVVDIETLKVAQSNLIETIEETMKIQEDGRAARESAQLELNKLEDDLKGKLLETIENQK